MRAPVFLVTLIFCIVGLTARSQSFYHLEYTLQKAKDATAYSAFFVKYEMEEGFIRIAYTSPENKTPMLVEMHAEIQYPDINDTNADTTKIFYQLTDPRIIKGIDKPAYDALLICFKINPVTQIPEPQGITSSHSTKEEDLDLFSGKDQISFDSLKTEEDLVEQYFNKKDTRDRNFLKNIFPKATRGETAPYFSPLELSTKLYLVIVADTKDTAIGISAGKDKENIQNDFTFIANAFKMGDPIIKIVDGYNVSKTNVQKAIGEVLGKVTPQDIFVFYYSGHGFRFDTDTDTFPRMKLWRWNVNIDSAWKGDSLKTEFVKNNSLSMDDVYMMIKNKNKGARLNLVISDCCNTYNKNTKPVYAGRGGGRAIAEDYILQPSNPNFRKLFLDPKPASVRITAAGIGQESPANDEKGGCFTKDFRSTLSTFLSGYYQNIPVTWDDLCKITKKHAHTSASTVKNTKGGFFEIYPYYRIE